MRTNIVTAHDRSNEADENAAKKHKSLRIIASLIASQETQSHNDVKFIYIYIDNAIPYVCESYWRTIGDLSSIC